MHLHKTSQSRLVAELTQEDLYGYKVSFEEMRMENEQTVQLLHDIFFPHPGFGCSALPPKNRLTILLKSVSLR